MYRGRCMYVMLTTLCYLYNECVWLCTALIGFKLFFLKCSAERKLGKENGNCFIESNCRARIIGVVRKVQS